MTPAYGKDINNLANNLSTIGNNLWPDRPLLFALSSLIQIEHFIGLLSPAHLDLNRSLLITYPSRMDVFGSGCQLSCLVTTIGIFGSASGLTSLFSGVEKSAQCPPTW